MVPLINVMKLPSIITRGYSYLRDSYALDFRSLAVFRIAVGLVVLVDLLRRFRHSLAFYSDIGVLPRIDALSGLNQYRWSLFFAGGSPEFVNLLFIIGFIATIAMILGWRTRLATIVVWVIVISVQSRNYHLNSGADTLLRVTMFWAMLLPLGHVWSLDRYLSEPKSESVHGARPRSVVSNLATFGLVLQTACVYLFTAILKDGPRWREEGSALYYALGARDLSTSLGDWLFKTAPESVLSVLTFGTLLMEFAVPIMLLIPMRSGWLRTVGIFLILGLHFGIFATMTVGVFPLISIAGGIGILPKWFWDKAELRVRTPAKIIAMLKYTQRAFESAFPQRSNDRVLVPGGVGSDSLANIASGRHLMRFAHSPRSVQPALGTIMVNLVAAIAIVMIMGWNIQTVSGYTVTAPLRQATLAAGLYQNWSMFAPGPQMSSVWYLAAGELESGEEVDVLIPIFNGDVALRNPVIEDQSSDLLMESKYWRKYFQSIRNRDTEKLRFAAYTCRTWNAENEGDDRLARVTLIRASARTLPDGERSEPVYDQLGSWRCL